MCLGIDALADEIVTQAAERPSQDGRPFELTLNVRHSLRQFAERIDEVYSIEVRAWQSRKRPMVCPRN